MKLRTMLLVGMGLIGCANVAHAGQKQQQPPPDNFFGFFPMHMTLQKWHYCYTDESCKAPHAGFDPHGNGVNPPIGAQTDQ